MIDTHAHIDAEAFDEDRSQMLDRAGEAGVNKIIVPATELPALGKLINIVERDERLYFAAGIHPHSSAEVTTADLEAIEEAAKRDKCVAIGEIGLDYYYDFSPKEAQKRVFLEQLKIAKRLNLPVIVHNRDSDEDMLETLQSIPPEERPTGVMHCFSGDEIFLEKVLKLGFYVSFTGNITFKKSNLNETVKRVPTNRFMLETDSPYMTPTPHRGKRNEPSLLWLIAEKIAEIKQITKDEVVKMTTENAKRLFRISMLLLALAAIHPGFIFSQEENDQEEPTMTEAQANPYHKFIGLGPVFGTNTIVTTYTPANNQGDVSDEGLFTIGGALVYSPLDFLVLEASYVVSKNTKVAEKNKTSTGEFLLHPNYHRVLDLSSHWIVNPYGRVNFFGTLGYSYLFNTYSNNSTGLPKDVTDVDKNQSSLNAGIGFYVNIPIESAGLFSISAEWRLNFVLNTQKLDYDPREMPGSEKYKKHVEINSFFSIPRVTILYYPKFL